MTGSAPYDEVTLYDFDLSDADFWTAPRAHREGAFKTLRDMFDTIRQRVPSLRITGEPDYLQSGFINGIKRMQCAWD